MVDAFGDAYDRSYQRGQNSLNALMAGIDFADRQTARKTTRNAFASFATDPLGAENALVAAGQLQNADALRARRREGEAEKDQAYLAKMLTTGRAGEAREWAISRGDPNLIKSVDQAISGVREQARSMASIATTLRENPDIEARRAQLQAMKPQLQRMGVPDSAIDSYDVSDASIDATVAEAIGLEKALGSVEVTKRGDYQDTLRVTPFGTKRLSSTLIPETRAEALDREQFGETRRRNAFTEDLDERQYGLSREQFGLSRQQFGETTRRNRVTETQDERRIRLAEEEAARGGDVNAIEGVRRKVAAGLPLSPGEQQLYEDSRRQPDPMAALYGLEEPAAPTRQGPPPRPAPARPPAARPAPARPADRPTSGRGPARPRTAAEFDRLPVGAQFINPADGRVLTKAR